MPENAKVLTVQTQNGYPRLWALVEEKNPIEQRIFLTVGTGHELPELPEGKDGRYIATFQLENGELVFHVFEIVRGP